MGAPLPRFVRRILLLSRARGALERDALDLALETCAAPELELDPEARAVREAALERLVKQGARQHEMLDVEGLESTLALIAKHAPERAFQLQRDLAAQDAAPEVEAPASSRAALQALLAELRGAPAGTTATPSTPTAPSAPSAPSAPGPDDRASAGPARARLFHLAVDDGGEFLVAAGTRCVLGHLRSPRADLPFLADVEGEHAELRLEASFHGGERWRIVPLVPARPIRARDLGVPAEGHELAHGDRVELARNLAFRFVASEPSSSSAILELEHGAECQGAVRILLLAGGASGRVRIGRKRRRLIPVADLAEDVVLELKGDELVVACAGGVRSGAVVVAPGPEARLALPCPPPARVDCLLGARARPPFMLLLRPLAIEGGGARA
ncbi:MAG: hypothetical protein HZA53_07645 [Planctomycetes bacterium]|nr:hypothetical protein [Planctomycetota bacterium]